MKRLLNELHRADRAHSLLKPGSSVLVALSGGPDSVCLLLLLNAVKKQKRLRIVAAHINHGLRASADSDESWASRFCKARGIPFRSARVRAASRALKERESVEEAARRARYDALVRIARAAGCSAIATGHTADDQAETVLMRLAGGCGLWGLAGIPAVRSERHGITVLRPLLSVPKREVRDALKRAGVRYRTDRSNRSGRFLRNRVRSEVLPLLRRRVNARADAHLADLAADAGRWRAWAEGEALRFVRRHGLRRTGRCAIRARRLRELPEPLRVPVYIKVLELISGREQHLRREHVRQIDDLLASGVPGRRGLAHGAEVTAVGDGASRRLVWRSSVIR